MRKFVAALLREREIGLLLLIVLLTIAATSRDTAFLAAQNWTDILVNAAPVMVVACGMMLVIVTGEIDISIGSLTGLLAGLLAVMSSTAQLHWHPAIAIIVTLAAGTLIGLGTGTLVTFGKVPSIIATLGLLTALRGATIWVMKGNTIGDFPPAIRFFGTGKILGVPTMLVIAMVVTAITGWLIVQTALGRRLFALGSNTSAAKLAGLSERRLKLFVFAWVGFLTAVGTVMLTGKLGIVDPAVGKGYELLVVTCVVVGGVSISGGRGKLRGVVLAVILMVMIKTVLIFLKLGDEATKWERAIQGAFILLAVVLDHLAAKRSAGGRA
jgi:ribose/xylose/arabinose/galactoside ABC-type transport system permease subunit